MEYKDTVKTQAITGDTGLKDLVVSYIGERLSAPEDITVDMAVEVFAAEFPDFLLAVAEENFLRGYEQALVDIEAYEKAATQQGTAQ